MSCTDWAWIGQFAVGLAVGIVTGFGVIGLLDRAIARRYRR